MNVIMYLVCVAVCWYMLRGFFRAVMWGLSTPGADRRRQRDRERARRQK